MGCRAMLLGAMAIATGATHAKLPPACWDAPRMLYLGPPPPEVAERVHLARVPGDGAEQIVVHNPDTIGPGPWRAALEIPLSNDGDLRVLLDGVTGPITPREVGASLVYVRVPWGRTTFSDLLIDRNSGELIDHEQVVDGSDAWRQARQSCALPEMAGDAACACAGDLHEWPRPRANPEPDSILGLLVLSGVFGPGETGGVIAADPVVPLPLYPSPENGLEPVLLVDDASELAWREYAYEAGAAVVIGRHDGWHRIRLADGGDGWVRPEHADRFLPLAELYAGAMTYMTHAWSGRLWRKGRGGWRAFGIQHGDETPVAVVAVQARGDSLWLEVEIPKMSPCDGGGSEIRDHGWVPAWNKEGEQNIWMFSRGC